MRLIMLPDADDHLTILPIEPSVVASHHTLQGRKLSDDAGQQIGFTEFTGAPTGIHHDILESR
jgi:hypothetical protein